MRTTSDAFVPDGQEPAIANVLEHVYQDNFREGIHDFGPRITSGPPRRRQPVRSSMAPRGENPANNRRLEASVIACLTSHGSCINGIAVSPDHIFFVSCSDDKTVKVWDTARLERNVTSKPRHSYTQHHSRVTCVCTIEESHCFASAAEDGSLHVVRVHVAVAGSLPKYGKLQTVREHRLDHPGEFITSMHHFNSGNVSFIPSNLFFGYCHCQACYSHRSIGSLTFRRRIFTDLHDLSRLDCRSGTAKYANLANDDIAYRTWRHHRFVH